MHSQFAKSAYYDSKHFFSFKEIWSIKNGKFCADLKIFETVSKYLFFLQIVNAYA
jgi:hypothetical protein